MSTDMGDDNDRTRLMPRAEPADEALPLGTRLAEFELIGLVGQGGFGIVYLARDHSLQRDVALKEYMPSSLAVRNGDTTISVRSERHRETFDAGLRSFVNEARLLAQFDHPALVKVFRFWEQNGTAYMVMPFYQGITLKQQLQQMPPPDEAWLQALLAPLLDALALMHAAQCFHRDIAPDNILLLPDGRPVLLDFGAARRVISDMNQALTVILKPGYAPIEQYGESSSMKQGAWTDLYALASVVYYAITGKTPDPAVTRIMHDDLIPLQQQAQGRYSEHFLRAIDAALAVKPEQRPQDVAQFRCMLGAADSVMGGDLSMPEPAASPLEHSTFPTTQPVSQPQTTAATDRLAAATAPKANASAKKLWLSGGVLALMLLSAAIWYGLRPSPPPAASTATAQPPASVAAPVRQTAAVSIAAAPEKPAFELESALDQLLQQADPGITVNAKAQNDRVRINRDRIGLSIESSIDGHVYILLRGTEGDFMLLYPNALDHDNRIHAGKTLRLPRPGAWKMVAGGPAGSNRFVVIVSPQPRDFSLLQPRKISNFQEFYLQALQTAHQQHLGPSPLLAGKSQCADNTTACPEQYGAASFRIEEIPG